MTFAWVRKLRTALHPLTVCRGLSAHHTFVDLGSCSQEVTTSALIVIYKQTSHHNVYTKYDRPFSIITLTSSHHYANIIIILSSCTSHHSASPRLSHTLPLAGWSFLPWLRLLRPVGLTTDVVSYRLRLYLRHMPPPLSLWYTGEVFQGRISRVASYISS